MPMTRVEPQPRGDIPREGLWVDHVSHAYEGVPVVRDVSLYVPPGEILCLLGPSGCGKTTTLRVIAGLEPLQAGRIALEGRVLADESVNVPPEDRAVSLLFQDFALFPHLTVLENVMFGLGRMPAAERRPRAMEVLTQVDMADYANAYPHVLSGGQQQRVALARARGPRPRLMLLDEPFSNLDFTLRHQVRDIVLSILHATTAATLMVTHDSEEAMFMGDRIAVMDRGRIVQQGKPEELYTSPANAFVLGLFGEVNRMMGRVERGHVHTPLGRVCAPGLGEGTEAEVLVRAEGVTIDPEAAPRGVVRTSRMLGRSTLVHLDVAAGEARPMHVHARIPGRRGPSENETVGLRLNDEHVFVFPVGDEKS
jgi:iron(III) transport system ATP-binding protein